MSTLKGTTMHPRCQHIGACWDLLECWFKLFSTSQNSYKSNSILNFFEKKIKFYGSHVVVLVNTFPFTYHLCRTDIDEARSIPFLSIRKLGVRTEFNFVNFELLKKFHIFGFPWCSTREDLSIDVSITNVGLILTKLKWFQLFETSSKVKIRISNFFEINQIFGFPWCSTHEDLSIDVSITNVGLTLTKLWWFQLFVRSQNSNFELYWK